LYEEYGDVNAKSGNIAVRKYKCFEYDLKKVKIK
jgi:hypothetical protein